MIKPDQKSHWLFSTYSTVIGILFLFTLTQVDLSLTLSPTSWWFGIQNFFQHIGFYERPTTTYWYVALLLALYMVYGILILYTYQRRISELFLWKLVGLTSVILIFSYPAFSYDIFNFIFYAKTIVVYHQNPYMVKPLDFVGIDPWLSFLHWTHRPSILPPLWTALTLIPYILGFNILLLTMWNFKILTTVFYVLAIYLLKRIMQKVDPKHTLLAMAFFAFNPLVIIESIVSAHLDIVMVALSYLFIFFLLQKKKTMALFSLALSVGIKYVTLVLMPLVWFGFNRTLLLVLMVIGFTAVVYQVEVQPWYLLWILPYTVFFFDKKWIPITASFISFGFLLRYAPYFYYGHWNDPVPFIKDIVTYGAVILAGITILLLSYVPKRKRV